MPEDGYRRVGRYLLAEEIASGGMGRVYIGRLFAVAGFTRPVAIKRLHEHYAKDPEFVSMLLDEARLSGRVAHPNVVQTLDVFDEDGEIFIVMEHVVGESLARLVRAARRVEEEIPFDIIASVGAGMLHGLHAAHEANDARGRPLGLVHRDVSPQNVLVGADGLARVLDFGIAKAAGRLRASREGQMKGKFAYMAPEQVRGEVTRRTDIFAAGVVLWEAITQRSLLKHGRGAVPLDIDLESVDTLLQAVTTPARAPREFRRDVPPALEAVISRALRSDPEERFATARDMALALESAIPIAASSTVGMWVERLAAEQLRHRREIIAEVEARSIVTDVTPKRGDGTDETAPSGTTEIGIEVTQTVRTAPRRLRRAAVALAWLAVAVAVVLVMARALSSAPTARTPVEPLPSVAAASVASAPIPETSPSTSVAAPPPSAIAVTSASSRAVRGPKTVRPPPPTRPRTSCDPPYEVGPLGQHQYKKHCL